MAGRPGRRWKSEAKRGSRTGGAGPPFLRPDRTPSPDRGGASERENMRVRPDWQKCRPGSRHAEEDIGWRSCPGWQPLHPQQGSHPLMGTEGANSETFSASSEVARRPARPVQSGWDSHRIWLNARSRQASRMGIAVNHPPFPGRRRRMDRAAGVPWPESRPVASVHFPVSAPDLASPALHRV